MVTVYIPKQGDLAWLTLDPTLGHEQKGRRPVMVVSSSTYNRIGMALICPVTSQVKGYPFEVPLKELQLEGAVLSDQIRAVDWQSRRLEFIEKASTSVLNRVRKNLAKLME
ncbi:type II toxin-antitoxin system PemK/MazF family toxin [Candidatus Peregrinibacteria bacterium]|nr:MAG: type II toxin-antitoxin system PemK/MazF family toxin [Candidatus Peregrinibacteria bacterium]